MIPASLTPISRGYTGRYTWKCLECGHVDTYPYFYKSEAQNVARNHRENRHAEKGEK